MNSKRATVLISALLAFCFPTIGLAQKSEANKPVSYYCVMDPEVSSDRPGTCPKCGMALRVAKDEPAQGSAADLVTTRGGGDPDAINDLARPGAIPDVTVYDQDGRMMHFYTDLVKGRTVAINFIFTTCTTICPPLAASFRRLQMEMGERVGRDIRLISISVDPVTDGPARLKAFGAKFKAGPGWTFVTGSKSEIDVLLRALGAFVSDKNDHTPMMLVGNEPAGFWTRTYGLAPTASLVKVISEAGGKTR